MGRQRQLHGGLARHLAPALLAVCCLAGNSAEVAEACFGAKLRIGVSAELALPAYATGYWVEEKTGIQPEFVELGEQPLAALARGAVDLVLVPAGLPLPEAVVDRPAGEIAGVGDVSFRMRADVLDDLRFFTVERALLTMPDFLSSPAYRAVESSAVSPKKAARQAVLRAD